jgi:hypothetical protein
MRSTKEQAREHLAAFQARETASPWKIDRRELVARLYRLVQSPSAVRQDVLPLCGPAALLRVWLSEDPLAVTEFATALYEHGRAGLGDIPIKPSRDLVKQDYAAIKAEAEKDRTNGLAFCPVAEWMMMCALRDAQNLVVDFEGAPGEAFAGLTTPGEMLAWLRATGIYREVTNEANRTSTKRLDHALALQPHARDVLLLVNSHMLGEKADAKKSGKALGGFPNHYIVLNEPIVEKAGRVHLEYWSWGDDEERDIPTKTFKANYYGALIGRPALYDVVIGDLVADPPGDDVAYGAGEYVRLDNLGTRRADLAGWRLMDEANHRLRIPPGYEIPVEGSLFVHTSRGPREPQRFFAGRRRAVWNNRVGDTARLYNAEGQLVDTYGYRMPAVPAA